MTLVEPADVLPLWPAGAQEMNAPSVPDQDSMLPAPQPIRIVRNVTRPTLTAFLPAPTLATGAAIIICPGGAFQMLSIEHEGAEVAHWLTARGVAAFVLRYRLAPTPRADEDFRRHMQEAFSQPDGLRAATREIALLASADGEQAVRLVRERASGWGISAEQVGILGFSAGGMVATGVALRNDPQSRPAFVAAIYGAPWEEVTAPAGAPPLFMVTAQDDQMARQASLSLHTAWTAAGQPVELHIYATGGHGFGMRRQGLPADGWIDAFGAWLHGQGVPIHL